MIPRNMRTGGMDLPGVESRDVPLIGYRPLAPDDIPLSSQSGQVTDSTGLDSSESSSRSQCVKAGTEEKLVQHLLHSFSMGDSSFITIFLSTYRSFTSTKRVLDILIDRAVCVVFSMWLSEYPEDFRSLGEPGLLLRLAPLLPSDPSGIEIRGRLLRIAEELSEQALLPDSSSDRTTASPPADPTKFDPTNILGFPAGLIAEQLTKIETRDKKGREGVCWSVRATVRQFNRLANAVMASCLWPTRLRSQQRARLLEKWISVAEECRARKNFSSLYAIVSALQSNPVHRLRRTWLDTDREAVRRYEELSNIFSEKDNYSQSRGLLKEVSHSDGELLHTRTHTHTTRKYCMYIHMHTHAHTHTHTHTHSHSHHTTHTQRHRHTYSALTDIP
ncbi:unnamed protein product [Coregonus sp. 'balchen']|nr:unnamed protein product [Coregonus sp. 'balchen']